MAADNIINPSLLYSKAKGIFDKVGVLQSAITSWSLLFGGRNNRAYRVDTTSGPFLLKWYYSGGEWNRQAAESGFLRFCEATGVRRVPRLLAEDLEEHISLYSWCFGECPRQDSLDDGDVAEAAAFLGDLCRASRDSAAAAMPPARDACLCLNDYFQSPQQRLAALEQELLNDSGTPLHKEALDFVCRQLRPAWERVREQTLSALKGEDLRKPLAEEKTIISPSDFGFHNALRLYDGSGVVFLDFEYAGRDDPAKAIGDFIFQPSFPPPKGALQALAASVYADRTEQDHLLEKVRILSPLFHIKFCCIILNEFKATDAGRREFAESGDIYERRFRQLEKVRKYLGII